MPLSNKAREAGVMQPAELELLGRVFDRTSVPNETEREREARASRIIGYFLAGIRDEDELSHLARQPLGR
jgi:hypothetical protein